MRPATQGIYADSSNELLWLAIALYTGMSYLLLDMQCSLGLRLLRMHGEVSVVPVEVTGGSPGWAGVVVAASAAVCARQAVQHLSDSGRAKRPRPDPSPVWG